MEELRLKKINEAEERRLKLLKEAEERKALEEKRKEEARLKALRDEEERKRVEQERRIRAEKDAEERKLRNEKRAEENRKRAAMVAEKAQEILNLARQNAATRIQKPINAVVSASTSAQAAAVPIVTNTKVSLITKVKNIISGNGIDGKSFKRSDIAKLGLNVLLSYGFVSNVSYVTCIISAWIAHGKRTGLSPLVPGQWKSFLAIYVGLWAANNVIRPLRFSLSLVLSPYFERFVLSVQKRGKLSRAAAIASVVFLVNVCGTLSLLFGGLFLGTKIAGVPFLS